MFSRASHFMEIQANRSNSYTDVIDLARREFLMQPSEEKKIVLFRHTGAVISYAPVAIKGKEKKWSLRSYWLACKMSPSQIKFGIGELTTYHGSDEDMTLIRRRYNTQKMTCSWKVVHACL